ncbi:MAG: hypothetical protein AAGI91_00380 [Bacteroidota bacterium]
MDPITLIVTALATGAAAGLKDMPAKIITDTYEGLKTLIKDKYNKRDADEAIADLEKKPASEGRKAVVHEELEGAGAGRDEAVLRQAQAVLSAVREHAPEAAEMVGVRLRDIEVAENLDIHDVVSSGRGVDAEGVSVGGSMRIGGVRAGTDGGAEPGKQRP